MAFAAPAIPYVVAGLGYAQYKNQGAQGKFNQDVQNRNAEVAKQEAQAIQDQLQFDLGRADEASQRAVGKTEVSIAKSGVDIGSETANRIRFANAKEKEMQDKIMKYNADVGTAKKYEQANYFTIQGQVARQTAKTAQISTLMSTGTSLMSGAKYS